MLISVCNSLSFFNAYSKILIITFGEELLIWFEKKQCLKREVRF